MLEYEINLPPGDLIRCCCDTDDCVVLQNLFIYLNSIQKSLRFQIKVTGFKVLVVCLADNEKFDLICQFHFRLSIPMLHAIHK